MTLFNSLHSIADFMLQFPDTTVEDLSSFLREWNPWTDPAIDELQLLQANVVKEYRIRTGSINKTYWRRLSFDELVIAEAEAQYLADLFKVLERLMQLHVTTEYLDKDVAEFDKWVESGRIHKDMAQERVLMRKEAQIIAGVESGGRTQVLNDAAVGEAMAMYGGLVGLIPGRYDIHRAYNDWLTRPSFLAEPEVLQNPVTVQAQEELILWRDSLSDVQSQFHSHWTRMLQDIIDHRHMNRIDRRNEENRIVLADEGIPLPRAESFLGWFGHAGITFRRLHAAEADMAARLCGFVPSAILTYMLPALPMTKEHVSYSLIQTADSTTNHSLSAKSKAHARDSNGRILFGQWRVRTVLLGFSPTQTYIVADEALSALDRRPMAIHEQHLAMLPASRSTVAGWTVGGRRNLDIFFPGLNIDQVGLTTGFLVDPSIRGSSVPVPWALFARNLGFPWASLAQQSRIHLRFNWTPEGIEAANSWTNHFENSACAWACASQGERKQWQCSNLVQHVRYIRGYQDEVVTRGKAGDTKFDLSWLK